MRTKLVIGLWMAGIALACAAGKFNTVTISGSSHEDGETRWTDWLIREATDRCDKPGVPRPVFPVPSRQQLADGSPDCIRNSIWVRNDSPRAIQCHLAIDAPNSSVPEFSIPDKVLLPATEVTAFSVIGRIVDVPTAFKSDCRIMPPPPLVKREIAPGCEPKLRVPNPDDFYPPGSVRRAEEGDVTFDFRGGGNQVREERGDGEQRAAQDHSAGANTSRAFDCDATATPFSLRGS